MRRCTRLSTFSSLNDFLGLNFVVITAGTRGQAPLHADNHIVEINEFLLLAIIIA